MPDSSKTIDDLAMLRLKDVDLSSLSDEELVAKYMETRKQMEKARKAWKKKQPVRVV